VSLPAAELANQHESSSSAGVTEKPTPVPTFRILVVDDNKDAANGLAKLLRIAGHEVKAAYDGLEALGAAAMFQPDIVVLDIGLPKLNGYEVAHRIRAERGNDVVLIAVTGWGQETDRRRSKEAGFDYHVTKPVEFAALKKMLASLALPSTS
jgi:CheY-like chemotaxis protein